VLYLVLVLHGKLVMSVCKKGLGIKIRFSLIKTEIRNSFQSFLNLLWQ
jgi:hypothetical protein